MDLGEFLALRGAAEALEAFAAGADAAFVAADSFIGGGVGAFEALPDVLEVLGEPGDAAEEFLGGVGDGAGVFGLGMLLPADGDGAEESDEGGWSGEEDAAVGGPDDEFAVSFEGGAEEGFGGDEEQHVIERVGELAGVIAIGEGLDGGPEFGGVILEGLGAAGGIGTLQGVDEVEVGDLGVDDDEPVAGEMDDEVGFGVAGLGLLAEVAVGAHAVGFDDAAKRFFAPASAGLVGAEDAAELEGFAGEGLALEGEHQSFLPPKGGGGWRKTFNGRYKKGRTSYETKASVYN